MKRTMLLILTLLLVLSCSSIEQKTDLDELMIAIEPKTVQQTDSGAWYYTVSVTTRGSVGVTVKVLTIKNYTMSGEFVSAQSVDEIMFAEWFSECGGEGSYIEPGVWRCGKMYSWGNPGKRVWIMEGMDDLGRTVSSSAEVTLR